MPKKLKSYSLALVMILCLIGASNVFGWPWSTDMWEQPSIGDYEEPIAYPKNSVSKGQPMKPVLLKREEFEKITQNPRRPTKASLEAGKTLFGNLCYPCHGPEGKGDGLVINKGFYPVDLTAPGTQGRTDGYIYSYIMYGGKVMMPSYNENVSPDEAWDIVNFVRKLQGKLNSTEEKGK